MPAAQRTGMLPPNLGLLFDGGRATDGRVFERMRVTAREQVIIRGWSADCADNEHHFARWMSGSYRPPVPPQIAARHPGVPGPTLDLVLYVCTNCEGMEVRDRTVDLISDFDGRGRRKLIASGQRDGFLGWYSGSRANQRTYVGMTA